ncbi:AAL066Wp [Eremothecium gossypii ATCC 10895]|uniref:AAL066Wp n=1 Tax=Eremothecium gossypii (strain ATCC 10895 / CBS 109.51 / FGSC 9923 / NRRL Y-1056) TaxID=284811 RepID=Q75EZ4_EREGS|nr:AAL066Wp [Eremothecium gossypii ATCC 10895]AAS50300.1 AAL066Wp [Eremothecium gossypii ATCC 10895]AEY94586.1 FAAL066Wp [Eremothecium gossypii FDAG1]
MLNHTYSDIGVRLAPRFLPDVSFMDDVVAPLTAVKPRPTLVPGISDGHLSLLAPVLAYWVFSGLFHVMDTLRLAEKYRIHPSEEVASRNRAGRLDVLAQVVLQHIIQTLTGLVLVYYDGEPQTGMEQLAMWRWRQAAPGWVSNEAIYVAYHYGLSVAKLLVGFFLIDTWQFWLHYLMHMNKTLYRKFHAHHHRLYVPYAYGALYNNPVEAFVLDSCGTALAALVTRMTHREEMLLYTFATMKTVDDHCGYALPWDPFQWLFPNNAVYHDIHHQNFGIKSNFAQPFFTIWDSFCRTKFPQFEEYEKKQRRVTVDRYKQFLAERQMEREAKLTLLSKKLS